MLSLNATEIKMKKKNETISLKLQAINNYGTIKKFLHIYCKELNNNILFLNQTLQYFYIFFYEGSRCYACTTRINKI